MTCLGPYEMLYFFLTLCFIVAKFCFSSSDYLNAYTHFFFTLKARTHRDEFRALFANV